MFDTYLSSFGFWHLRRGGSFNGLRDNLVCYFKCFGIRLMSYYRVQLTMRDAIGIRELGGDQVIGFTVSRGQITIIILWNFFAHPQTLQSINTFRPRTISLQ